MAKFLRCVGVDHVAYHVNVEQIAWVFRPMGARHTVIRLSGTPDALTVLQTPEQITSHAHSDEHEDHDSLPIERTRMAGAQPRGRSPSAARAFEHEGTSL
jgi:hypothetical protein